MMAQEAVSILLYRLSTSVVDADADIRREREASKHVEESSKLWLGTCWRDRLEPWDTPEVKLLPEDCVAVSLFLGVKLEPK